MKNNAVNIVYIDPILKDLIPKFMDHQVRHVHFLKAAVLAGNFADIKTLGHQMKGASGGYGFLILGEYGKKIERLAEEQNVEELDETITELESYLSSIIVEYKGK
jgi:HPt (histidine-containing phosphotransfer) domain-containing protein